MSRYVTEGGAHIASDPDLLIQFDDPRLPGLRQKQIAEIADGVFRANGIKRYWAGCDGKTCVVAGWGG